MAMTTWKVELYETRPHAQSTPGVGADLVDTFGVQADGHDMAKREVKKFLTEKGRKIRAVSFTTTPNQMVAYVEPKPALKR